MEPIWGANVKLGKKFRLTRWSSTQRYSVGISLPSTNLFSSGTWDVCDLCDIMEICSAPSVLLWTRSNANNDADWWAGKWIIFQTTNGISCPSGVSGTYLIHVTASLSPFSLAELEELFKDDEKITTLAYDRPEYKQIVSDMADMRTQLEDTARKLL